MKGLVRMPMGRRPAANLIRAVRVGRVERARCLGALLHSRLSADALLTPRTERSVKRDVDVLEMVGLLLVGRGPLLFTRAHPCVTIEGGGTIARCADGARNGFVVCGASPMSGNCQAYAEFTLLPGTQSAASSQPYRGVTVGVGRPTHPVHTQRPDEEPVMEGFWGVSEGGGRVAGTVGGGTLILDGQESDEWELGSPRPASRCVKNHTIITRALHEK